MIHKDESKIALDSKGTKRWFNEKGHLHRTDGPAVEYADGSKSWYLNGLCHRTDGPSCEYANGSKEWYLNGIKLPKNMFLKPVKNLPLYLGLGFDLFISERLQHESSH